MKNILLGVVLALSGIFSVNTVNASDGVGQSPAPKTTTANPCPTNDSVCAEQKARELQKAAKDHEEKMEELKARALGKV